MPQAQLGRRRALRASMPPSATALLAARRASAAQRNGPCAGAPGWLAVGKAGESSTPSAPIRRARARPERPCAAWLSVPPLDQRQTIVRIDTNDQVLYLKHNLNAQAIAALQGELVGLEENVDRLVREMEASIREADQFISKLQKT